MIFTLEGLAGSLFQQEAKDGDLGKMANSHFCDKYYKDHNNIGKVLLGLLDWYPRGWGCTIKETRILTPASALILHIFESSSLKHFGR